MFDIESGQELATTAVKGSAAVEFVDDDRRLGIINSIGAAKDEVFVWDYPTDQRTLRFDPGVYRGKFSADGSRFAAESGLCASRVWDTERGSELITTGPLSSYLWTIAFSPDGRYLATAGEGQRPRGGEFGEIRIWDAATGSEVATIIDDSSWGVTALAFSPGGTELASGNGSGIVRFWKVPPASQPVGHAEMAAD